MRVVYTDRYALRLLVWLFLAVWFAYQGLSNQGSLSATIWFLGALWWAALFAWELTRRVRARRAGRDPSIIRIVDRA